MTAQSFAHGLVGITLDGRYRLDAVLGEGGMGAVFRATQLAMDRKVAVKLLKPHLASDEAALQRFAREARATLKVDSPHAVKVLDFGVTPQRDYYIVLEYLDGRTVQRELEIDGRFAPARVAHIARQALSALAAAHSQGLIHRDVKPDNLLLMRAGNDADHTKVLDFGVAKLMQGAAGEQLALTAAGMVFGTPEYMSPEQACGHALDGRSDLYSLAVTMHVMLTGRPMFQGATAIEWLTHHVRTPAPRLAEVRPELTAFPDLDALLQRCLAKDREQRPASAEEMSARIAELAPTLSRAPVTPPALVERAPTPRTPTRVSSYVEALRDPTSPYPPSAPYPPNGPGSPYSPNASPHSPNASPHSPNAAGSPYPPNAPASRLATTKRSRGLYIGLGGITVAALIGASVGMAIRKPSTTEAPEARPAFAEARLAPGALAAQAPTASPTAPPATTPAPPPPATTAGLPERQPISAALPSVVTPPAAAPAPRARPSSHAAVTPVRGPATRNPEADQHLRSAEDAFRGGNRLRQLAEADLALRADPSSVRAKYLLADALLKGDDLDRGCAHLHEIKAPAQARVQARTRARAAGCPGD